MEQLDGRRFNYFMDRYPRTLIANHLDNVSMGTDNIFTVQVIDENESPVSGANVNLNFNDIYINAISGEDGNAIIDLNDLSGQSGEVVVTVTCQDCVYSETSFVLNQESIFPEILGASLLFEEINTSSNQDGFVNPGEQLSIDFYMTNYSGASMEDINVEIRSSQLSVTSENTINIPNIDIGQTVLVEDLILNIPHQLPLMKSLCFMQIFQVIIVVLNQIRFYIYQFIQVQFL